MVPRNFWVGVLALLGLCAGGPSNAQTPELAPQPGVLLLRGGGVLRGAILQVGDRYEVGLGGGSRVSVAEERVRVRCDSLQQAYTWQRRLLPANASVAEHLELGDWCLRYELLRGAAEQLIAATRRDPNHPRLRRFEKRLRLAAHPPERSPAISPVAPAPSPLQELDAFASKLPDGAVEQFTRTIQPLLLNGCAAAKCHGTEHTGPFRLVRPAAHRPMPRTFTLRNLRTAVNACDPEQPDLSPLLLKATSAHGAARDPTIDERDVERLEPLAAWVFLVASRGAAEPTATGSLSGAPEAPSSATASNGAVQPASHTTPAAVSPAAEPPPGDAGPPPQDPFDPEVFNRRYRKGNG